MKDFTPFCNVFYSICVLVHEYAENFGKKSPYDIPFGSNPITRAQWGHIIFVVSYLKP